jgi:hypothetical protein
MESELTPAACKRLIALILVAVPVAAAVTYVVYSPPQELEALQVTIPRRHAEAGKVVASPRTMSSRSPSGSS